MPATTRSPAVSRRSAKRCARREPPISFNGSGGELPLDVVDKLLQHLVGFFADNRLAEFPDLAEDVHVRLYDELGLFRPERLELHGRLALDGARGHAVVGFCAERRAPAFFVLLFEKNFALKVERD